MPYQWTKMTNQVLWETGHTKSGRVNVGEVNWKQKFLLNRYLAWVLKEVLSKFQGNFHPFTTFVKRSMLDVWQGSENAPDSYNDSSNDTSK